MRKAIALVALLLAGCAPYGPWTFSTEKERQERLCHEGMTLDQIIAKKGLPLLKPYFNPAVPESHFTPSKDFGGVAWWTIEGSSMLEEIDFDGGVSIQIEYVRSGRR